MGPEKWKRAQDDDIAVRSMISACAIRRYQRNIKVSLENITQKIDKTCLEGYISNNCLAFQQHPQNYRQNGALSHDGKVDGEGESGGVTKGEREAGFGEQMAQRLCRTPKASEAGKGEDGTKRK